MPTIHDRGYNLNTRATGIPVALFMSDETCSCQEPDRIGIYSIKLTRPGPLREEPWLVSSTHSSFRSCINYYRFAMGCQKRVLVECDRHNSRNSSQA